MNPSDLSISKSQWVDRYLLRYGPATILGAIITAYFYSKRRQLGISNSLALSKLELYGVFIGIGFLYAYVASAPILVFHFTRSLYLDRTNRRVRFVLYMVIFSSLMTAPLVSKFFDSPIALSLAVSGVAGLHLATLTVVVWAYLSPHAIYAFYVKLAKRREADLTGFVESYRTLREHGNAFYILMWEILLATPLIFIVNTRETLESDVLIWLIGVIIVLWVAPASMAWYIAGQMEVIFSGYAAKSDATDTISGAEP